jgi:GGDEF domain-containing protein
MSIKKTLSTYRLTLLLYLGVLLLPLIFLLSLRALDGLEEDTRTIRELGRTGGNILAYTLTEEASAKERLSAQIRQSFDELGPWFRTNTVSSYYVGSSTPEKDFLAFRNCWNSVEKSPETSRALRCWNEAKPLIFAVERMVAIHTSHIRNLIVLDIVVAIGVLLLLIFVVRYLIHHQICKNIVHAPEEGLHDRDYCRHSLEELCAQAGKLGGKLSTLHIIFPSLGEESQLSLEKQALLTEALDEIIRTSTRVNDIPCRIGDDEYLIIQPFTGQEEAVMAKERMKRVILEKLRERFPTISPRFKPTSLQKGESCEEFIERCFKRNF